MNLTVLPQAELEAAEAAIWYDDRCLGLGDDFLAELAVALDRIRSSPTEHSRLEGSAARHEIRRCLLKRFPYVVIYCCRPQEVLIVAISHARQRPRYWLKRILGR